jgi:hypothetical protein
MKNNISMIVFIFVELFVVTYILSTTGALPENIASHFNGAGLPNGFMSQKGYLIFMLVFAVGIPSFVIGSMSIVLRKAQSKINIPNRDFWLAPERRQKTILFINNHISWLGSFIALFIAYVHWLLIKANSTQPVQLSNELLFIGMGVFLVVILVWGALLSLRFMRLPK